MIKLTDRLQFMADFVEKGHSVADIGTDHGLLPMYLYEQGISPKVIMCDISEPSLSKARQLAGAFAGENVLFRAGDGISVLRAGEVDDVIIAGMGGILISDIITCDLEKARGFKKFILQPRNKEALLRYNLEKSGFLVEGNALVREGKRICEVIVATPGDSEVQRTLGNSDDPTYEMPGEYVNTSQEIVAEFVHVKTVKYEKILEGLKGSSEPDCNAIDRCLKRIDFFRRFL